MKGLNLGPQTDADRRLLGEVRIFPDPGFRPPLLCKCNTIRSGSVYHHLISQLFVDVVLQQISSYRVHAGPC